MSLTTPKMSLHVWDQLNDLYDHVQQANNWAKVDLHDHTPGRGVQIPTEGIFDGAITAAKLAAASVVSKNFAPTLTLANNSAGLNLTSSAQDVPGLSMTFTPTVAGRSIFVAMVMGRTTLSAAVGAPVIRLSVDGVEQAYQPSVTTPSMTGTVTWNLSGIWVQTLTAASHTVKVRAIDPVNTGTIYSAQLFRMELGN
jgi:hypothetical protein